MPRKFRKELSLAYLYPKLVKEWDYEKNYPLTPEDVYAHGDKKVGWVCHINKNHKWDASIGKRSHGQDCPYCSGHRVCKDNCLATLNPELAKEWDYEKNYPLTPEDVTLGSHKKVGWIHKKNKDHRWNATINNRSLGSDCPCCSTPPQKVCKDNCLATLNPELAKEWDYEKNYPLTPEDVFVGSVKKVHWKCKNNHEWMASIDSRNSGCGCPYCSNQKVCKDNCLATVNPKFAKDWDYKKNYPLTPEDVVCGGSKRYYWKCKKCGYEWWQSINRRNLGYKKCKKCNCLAIIYPKLAKEWDYEKNYPLTPEDVMPHSSKKVGWICKDGHKWDAIIASRSDGRGCPYCNSVELKDGTVWDSITEVSHYFELCDQGVKCECHVSIGLGQCTCDFYIPSTNTYIDVTGYTKAWKYWKKYRKGIIRKKNRVTRTLKANYIFIKKVLTPQQIRRVRENMK
jgi:positive regulator of sigma E activity